MVIGASNGWIYHECDIYNVSKQQNVFKKCGANALEISLYVNDSKRIDFLKKGGKYKFDYLSLYINDYNPYKPLVPQVKEAREIIDAQNPSTALVHPLGLTEEYFEAMWEAGIPISIENMDKDKDSGYDLKELSKLVKEYNLGFVLDVQHAYEHDPSMQYACDLFDCMRGRLTHLHVSGESKKHKEIHSLLHKAENKDAILDFVFNVLLIKEVPIILEGHYKTTEALEQEVNFVEEELSLP